MQRTIWIVLLPLFLILLSGVSWVSYCHSATQFRFQVVQESVFLTYLTMYRKCVSEPGKRKRKREEESISDCESSNSNVLLRRDSTVAELKEMKISCVDQWKELFDKTYIPFKGIRVAKSTYGGQDLHIWYPRKGRDSMNKGSSGDSSRSLRSKSITYHPYNSQVESEEARSKSVVRLLAFKLPYSMRFKVMDKLEKDKTTFLWFHLESDEGIFAWFKHITRNDSEEEREELQDWICKWELGRKFSRMVPSSLPNC